MRFLGRHGVLAEELARAQPFEVDLDLWADLGQACATDNLGATVDYGALCDAVRAVIEGPHVNLLERLAELVAQGALAVAGQRAEAVVVTVRKLRPPVAAHMASASVTVTRRARATGAG